jgi:arylsulfatase A-like enzyme
MIRFPGQLDGGRQVDDVVRIEDLFPTILELCGLAAPEGLDGCSLLELASGRIALATYGNPLRDRIERDRPGFRRTPLGATIRSVYDGRHHLVQYSDGREELYDVQADPGETNDLAPDGGPALSRMRTLIGGL